MTNSEPVKLDVILKYLFSMSDRVLINLLNGVFNENFREDEVTISKNDSEFIDHNMNVIRGDMFIGLNKKRANYHIEFQTRNDSTMIIRMFEYGFQSVRDEVEHEDNITTIYMPKQKVIFFEENRNIEDILKMRIVLQDSTEIVYKVDVIKYWEMDKQYLYKNKMYPLLPIQLFNLRKELSKAKEKNDIDKIDELCKKAKQLAYELADMVAQLFNQNEIIGDDLHKMLLGIQNLIEYLNNNYMNNKNIEQEVNNMTKSLYDEEVARINREQGIEKGREEGRYIEARAIAKSLLDVLDIKTIAMKTKLTESEVLKLKNNNQ